MNSARLGFAAAVLAATSVVAQAAYNGKPGLWLGPSQLPLTIGEWKGREGGPLDAETMAVLRADGVINRVYASAADRSPVDLYVAYYARQQPGVSIHSPLHCLPGTGWETLDVATIDLPMNGAEPGHLRRLIVGKNRERALVLYWYAIHGRMLANEVVSKAWLLHDSLRFGRSDAALVRIVVPLAATGDAAAAEESGLAFARAVLPYLQQLWS
jgi:EpsI family protein